MLSMIPGGLSIRLHLHPLPALLLQSTTALPERGERPRDTRVAPCSDSLHCLSLLPSPSNTSLPTTARPRMRPSTTRPSGTSIVSTADVSTVLNDTRLTSWLLDMDPRPSQSKGYRRHGSIEQASSRPFKITYSTSIQVSASSVQKVYVYFFNYPGSYQPHSPQLDFGYWIHDRLFLTFEISLRRPIWHLRLDAQKRSILFAICTHIGAPPNLTKTHKACDHPA